MNNLNSNLEEAKKVIKSLKGTLIADLFTMKTWAENYHDLKSKESFKECGGLNYSLFLLCLIACETLGFYLMGACFHKEKKKENWFGRFWGCLRNLGHRSKKEHLPEIGKYTMNFLQEGGFPPESYFKKLRSVLARYLRDTLVHGFGSLTYLDDHIDLGLFIKNNNMDAILDEENKKIKLNGVSFANQIINVFERKIESEINSNSKKAEEIAGNIIKAKSYCEGAEEFKVPKKVINAYSGDNGQ